MNRTLVLLALLVAVAPEVTTQVARKYTVQEIDDLRQVCEDRYLWGTSYHEAGSRMSRSYTAEDMIKAVEEMVRTYMVAGITAKQIRDEDERKALEHKKRLEKYRKETKP